MKKWIAILVLGGAAGGAVWYTYFRPKPVEASSTLITAPVARGDVVETVQATGTLEAVTTVQVGTQVSGSIKALYADFNSQVRQGQVVAELDPSLFEAQVEQVRASLVRVEAERDRARVQVEDAQIKLTRARELSGRQLIPMAELETAESTARQAQSALQSAEAQLVQARASLNQSQVNLGHTIIRAPIDGVVVSRNVDVGQTVAASMQAPTLFVIANDLAEMQVSASIDESDIGRIAPGQRVTFRVDAYPDDTFGGRVQQVRLQPVVTQNVVSYTTIISVPNPTLTLKPGMTATVTVQIAAAEDVLRVPNAALRFQPSPELFASLGQTPPAAEGASGADGASGASGTDGASGASGADG
ncbi:MAG: efflux RND transporter periplasmic adaptor subunit, partial [Acidimicrobiia bacterium]|nr:efflux RND transporter periplasmic adaptor subunit [Acidimicrobiia bacterium]